MDAGAGSGETGGWPVWWPDGRAIVYLVAAERGDQEVRMVDRTGRLLPARAWPRFVGTNQPLDVFRRGASVVTAAAVHQSTEVWLLRR